MDKLIAAAVALLCVLVTLDAQARDTRHMFSVSEALQLGKDKGKIDGSVAFYFGDQKHPRVVKKLGEFMSNKKTNAFNKSDEYACQWAFVSAMISFQQRAQREGGNAVVNIRSYYKKNEISSATEFECGAGAVIAGVTFLGDVVEIAK